MIFISAQPDEYYFYWQLELQIFNFRNTGIDFDNVHILIGYEPQAGLSADFKAFKKKYKTLNIFAYSDTRKSNGYLASIRPHIIAKHFEQLPQLCTEAIFLHDSDIVFSSMPDFELLLNDDVWYAADCSNYLDTKYILATAGEQIFFEMCALVGINPEMVKQNDKHAGGAQYIFKNPPISFWNKVETDGEEMYKLLISAEKKLNKDSFEKQPFIQTWCADMWVFWWSVLLMGKSFKIHTELDFAWANSPITEWTNKKILHYTGSSMIIKNYIFTKGDYILYPPYHTKFDMIARDSCSYPFVQLIKDFVKTDSSKKEKLTDFTFVLAVKIDSPDRLSNLHTVTSFLDINLNTNIIVMEMDSSQKINPDDLPESVKYHFEKTDDSALYRTYANNKMIKMSLSKFVAIYDVDIIVPVKQLVHSARVLRDGQYKIVSPYDGTFLNVDILMKEMFIKFQDATFLEVNQNKTGMAAKRSFKGCVLVDKAAYILAGMDNEHITSSGLEHIERIKRMEILGYKTIRIGGKVFHLHHEKVKNSVDDNPVAYEKPKSEYLEISDMTKNELTRYIENWKWTKN
jgi:hypothetical protein